MYVYITNWHDRAASDLVLLMGHAITENTVYLSY